jgi:hypothetical protein
MLTMLPFLKSVALLNKLSDALKQIGGIYVGLQPIDG